MAYQLVTIWNRIKAHLTVEHCVVRLLMAWCFINLIQIINAKLHDQPGFVTLNFVGEYNFLWNLLLILITMVVFYLLFELVHSVHWEKRFFFLLTFMYALLCVLLHQELYFCIGMSALMTLSTSYCFGCLHHNNRIQDSGKEGVKSGSKELCIDRVDEPSIDRDRTKWGWKDPILSKRMLIFFTIVFGALFVLFTGGCTIYKYLTYNSPNYDLGLFSQMFHYMKTSFTMNTTSERDELLSHFCVHISPVFYLLLPAYWIYSSPAVLQLMQAVVLALSLIPMFLICRDHRLSNGETLAVMAAFCLYPVFSAGCFYDIHENCFLPVFLLFLLYYMGKDSWKGILISMVLVFSVKEDAAIYVAIIALYMIFGKKMYKKGAVVFASSILYFAFTTLLLAAIGEGAMVYRFDNMIYGGGDSMLGIIRTVITDPAYLVMQVFTQEKMEFLLQVMLPLLFLPCVTRKWPHFLLFGPFLLFNMMSDYTYFHSLYFQYVFGSGTLLFYLAVINAADLKQRYRHVFYLLMAVVSSLFFFTLLWNKTDYIHTYYESYQQRNYSMIEEALDQIPDDASVTATTFLCPALSDRDVLYELYYTEQESEYIVLDLRVATTDYSVNTYLDQDGYETIYYEEGLIAVFRNLNYQKQ